MNPKFYSLLGLCQRAKRLVSGGLSCENALREGESVLLIIAKDASESTVKKFQQKAFYYQVECVHAGTGEEIGRALGKDSRSVVSINDKGFGDKIKLLLNDETK